MSTQTIGFTDTFHEIIEAEDLAPPCDARWHELCPWAVGPDVPPAEWYVVYEGGTRFCGCPRPAHHLYCDRCYQHLLVHVGKPAFCPDCLAEGVMASPIFVERL